MIRQRIVRLMGALLLVTFGVNGVVSPLAHLALMRSMPDCVEAGAVGAAVGRELRLLTTVAECPYGSFAPTASFHVVAQALLTVSLAVLLLGVVALGLALGVSIRARRMVRQLRGWVARRLRMVVSATSAIVFQLGRPVMVPVVVRPVRSASHPRVRRGPPSCSC